MSLVLIVMGVAGSGKTTIGTSLARRLGWVFRDADEFHPAANREKMSLGIPLTDADRAPWLAAIAAEIGQCLARGDSVVVACSALRASYREVLASAGPIRFIHLAGDPAVLAARLAARHGHFFSPTLLPSQLETLEPPKGALVVDIQQPPEAIVTEILRRLDLPR